MDTIYYDSRTQLQAVQVETGQWQGIMPSDRFGGNGRIFTCCQVNSSPTCILL
ncbi:MAG: hypothetical protein EBE86_002540 [Hormoscilla sp. GUM202]|nr:hypothetical protein [Hormoscilla sp. GUM202]